jgi:hypothetical protein
MSKPPPRPSKSESSSPGSLWSSATESTEEQRYSEMLDAATRGLMDDGESAAPGAIGLDLKDFDATAKSEESDADFDSAAAAASASQRGAIPSSVSAITLDYGKAGLAQDTKGQALANQPRPGAVPAQTSEEDLEYARRAGMPIPEASKTDERGRVIAKRSIQVSLLGIEDRVTSVLAGLALGLLVSMWGGNHFATEMVDEQRDVLLTELKESAMNPLSVDADDLRTLPEIKADLAGVGEAGSGTFMRWWFGLGIPLGLALALIQRQR